MPFRRCIYRIVFDFSICHNKYKCLKHNNWAEVFREIELNKDYTMFPTFSQYSLKSKQNTDFTSYHNNNNTLF